MIHMQPALPIVCVFLLQHLAPPIPHRCHPLSNTTETSAVLDVQPPSGLIYPQPQSCHPCFTQNDITLFRLVLALADG